jgi:hypothetical protein
VNQAHDLSGRWIGIYNYPHTWPPIEFETELSDTAGLVTGSTTETGAPWEPSGSVVKAAIQGRREESKVRFSKVYDDDSVNDLWVEYEGAISIDGNEIEGQWTVPGEWSGSFMMVRQAGQRATVEAHIEANV